MAKTHATFPFELVITVGDNLYGSERPQDFQKKFEIPYKPLLDASVKFYASLGNHDSREQRFYKLFNMDGKLYYSFKAPSAERPVLRVREHVHGARAGQVDRGGAAEDERGLEDPILSSPAVLVRRAARIGHASPRRARAALRQEQRQRRLYRTRSLLRADQATERDRATS